MLGDCLHSRRYLAVGFRASDFVVSASFLMQTVKFPCRMPSWHSQSKEALCLGKGKHSVIAADGWKTDDPDGGGGRDFRSQDVRRSSPKDSSTRTCRRTRACGRISPSRTIRSTASAPGSFTQTASRSPRLRLLPRQMINRTCCLGSFGFVFVVFDDYSAQVYVSQCPGSK